MNCKFKLIKLLISLLLLSPFLAFAQSQTVLVYWNIPNPGLFTLNTAAMGIYNNTIYKCWMPPVSGGIITYPPATYTPIASTDPPNTDIPGLPTTLRWNISTNSPSLGLCVGPVSRDDLTNAPITGFNKHNAAVTYTIPSANIPVSPLTYTFSPKLGPIQIDYCIWGKIYHYNNTAQSPGNQLKTILTQDSQRRNCVN